MGFVYTKSMTAKEIGNRKVTHEAKDGDLHEYAAYWRSRESDALARLADLHTQIDNVAFMVPPTLVASYRTLIEQTEAQAFACGEAARTGDSYANIIQGKGA